jgi:predicted extracellular nuclease
VALSALALTGASLTVPVPAAINSTSVARADDLEPVEARIHEIQGTSRLSPLKGEAVADVPGIVTAKRQFGSARGFWFQDPDGDDDPRTSEALFAFTGNTTPDVEVGDEVLVDGVVQEWYPTNPDTSPHQSSTELTDVEWTVESSGNELPEPELIKPDTAPDVLTAKPGGSIEELELEPDRYALDFWESREHMLAEVSDVRLVGPSTRFNELYATTKPDQFATPRGGAAYTGYDADPTGILKIESLIPFEEVPFPEANTGDTLAGSTIGPISYKRFGGYTLNATELGQVVDGGIERESTREQNQNELAVASYNVENLSGVDSQQKFDDLAAGVVDHLASPDIVTLEEIQDNNGPDGTGDGVVEADETLDRFVEAIENAGGPGYEWRQIDPEEGADGGQPGGNIRVGFLFNPDRVSFADREGGDATTPVEVQSQAGKPRLSISPGRIDPENDAWQRSRKSLAGEFVFRGRTVFVVANHFNAKSADQPVHGRYQPPDRVTEAQRVQQAEVVRGFVDDLLEVDSHANVVVAGDINDYAFSQAVEALTEGDALRTLHDTLPEEERYTYIFEGKSQVLDHILVSRAPRNVEFEVVHINAEFHDQVSDHDPLIARFEPGAGKSAGQRR